MLSVGSTGSELPQAFDNLERDKVAYTEANETLEGKLGEANGKLKEVETF